jgi:hypothetical protein
MNIWEAVFAQSKVNDGYHDEDRLPQVPWKWPSGTWFQARRDFVREHEQVWNLRTPKDADAIRTS